MPTKWTYKLTEEEFIKHNCKLLTTEDEYNEMIKQKIKFKKYKYIASCGCENIVYFHVFLNRKTGVICSACKSKEVGLNNKNKIKNNEVSKIYTNEQEHNFILNFKELVKSDFICKKAFDACYSDIIIKPNNIEQDKWIGIQVKTSNKRHLTYSFQMNNEYIDIIILLYNVEDDLIWLIPPNTISNRNKISIGYNKSKYNIYKVSKEELANKLLEYYNCNKKFSFEELDKPINIYQQREKEVRKYREEKLKFINFIYEEKEGTVYDFKINNLKIQEKVTSLTNKNKLIYFLLKNNGLLNGKRNVCQYDIGDNDFYWLNVYEKGIFFIIPEKVLIDKGFIGNKNKTKHKMILKFSFKNSLLSKSSLWLKDYMFNYNQYDKNKISTLLKI